MQISSIDCKNRVIRNIVVMNVHTFFVLKKNLHVLRKVFFYVELIW